MVKVRSREIREREIREREIGEDRFGPRGGMQISSYDGTHGYSSVGRMFFG